MGFAKHTMVWTMAEMVVYNIIRGDGETLRGSTNVEEEIGQEPIVGRQVACHWSLESKNFGYYICQRQKLSNRSTGCLRCYSR
jgi:hypothetical protein